MIKFDSDLWLTCGFLWVLQFLSPIKTGSLCIAEILLKVALNTITLTLYKLNLSSDDLLNNNHFQSKWATLDLLHLYHTTPGVALYFVLLLSIIYCIVNRLHFIYFSNSVNRSWREKVKYQLCCKESKIKRRKRLFKNNLIRKL